jgi:hypothetical protein
VTPRFVAGARRGGIGLAVTLPQSSEHCAENRSVRNGLPQRHRQESTRSP